jgi:hypothetical protein
MKKNGFAELNIVFAFILSAITLFPPFAELKAQNPKTSDIVRYLTETIRTMPAVDMDFELIQDKSAGKGSSPSRGGMSIYKGVVQAQGNSYKLTNPELELYCDGFTKWILNISAKELVIVPNDATATDIVENPLGFLTSLSKGYEYPFRVFSGSRNGKQIWIVDFTPLNKRLAYKSISVGIEKNTYIPLMIKYLAKDGTSYIINITRFEKQNSVRPREYFQFPAARLKGLEVSDMR